MTMVKWKTENDAHLSGRLLPNIMLLFASSRVKLKFIFQKVLKLAPLGWKVSNFMQNLHYMMRVCRSVLFFMSLKQMGKGADRRFCNSWTVTAFPATERTPARSMSSNSFHCRLFCSGKRLKTSYASMRWSVKMLRIGWVIPFLEALPSVAKCCTKPLAAI